MENEVINKNNKKGKILIATSIFLVVLILVFRQFIKDQITSTVQDVLLVFLLVNSVLGIYISSKMSPGASKIILKVLSIVFAVFISMMFTGIILMKSIEFICKSGGGC